ncbi:LEAF RUST 10 DISEASE-RESISTANCE LOCUS RECEPTOR-LIKE PROTEIN KINASE-like 2.1 [Eucalyptus grandis]|uniref:LEAF RUST 10 DISEASE-RESISTANCE LOCUS RECEPTOR-LIKE PROTEIN KINASE-like 2.1 n=1 Tax=Eucalyptus grandis TaxID=71139 RepID=UPI00192E7C1B|nr:LEAF RUST 10 DISEASE-RESISTANCE LOCUS RECEPTOR-LIKE PROTEIN KINASE-like 2.1 [Eucalyptus grandis]
MLKLANRDYEEEEARIWDEAYGPKIALGECYHSVNLSAIQDIEANVTLDALKAAIKQGFGMQWPDDDGLCQKCLKSGGQCGQVQNSGEFTCYCRERSHSSSCPAFLAALSVSMTTVLLICFIRKTNLFKKERSENHCDVDEFMRNHGSLVPRRYKYTDVKKMTNSLSVNVGQGGYGVVYKGKLKDGRPVAVKFLKESKGNGEEFINEVTSISRTAHVNIVALLGFCYEKNRRALIYEYMPNGSLDKYLPSQGASSATGPLEWKISYKVALGVARGLEYLHRGCSTRILHFDIKPQNILLDQDFVPKISDFGLAKLCKGRESVVSMNFGGVSHKSDVYSYGMLVLEMVGGRNNYDAQLSKGSQMYFPELVYRHLEPDKGLQLRGINTPEEEETARKMIIVSIWCIQTNPSNRPSISKVIEMLEGSLDLLPIPPIPYLTSPPVSPKHFETTTSSSSVFINSKGQEVDKL